MPTSFFGSPLMVLAFHSPPRGPGMPSAFSAVAIWLLESESDDESCYGIPKRVVI